jgi:hypothetical protein
VCDRTTPVISGPRLGVILTPVAAVGVLAVAVGPSKAAGFLAVAVALIAAASWQKFIRPAPQTPPRAPSRPAFTDPPNPATLPRSAPARPVDTGRADRIKVLADDPRAPEGERVAAREALRRIQGRP